MSFKEINRLCVCSHIKEKHRDTLITGEMRSFCHGCYATWLGMRDVVLHDFKQDNLKYLLERYESKQTAL